MHFYTNMYIGKKEEYQSVVTRQFGMKKKIFLVTYLLLNFLLIVYVRYNVLYTSTRPSYFILTTYNWLADWAKRVIASYFLITKDGGETN